MGYQPGQLEYDASLADASSRMLDGSTSAESSSKRPPEQDAAPPPADGGQLPSDAHVNAGIDAGSDAGGACMPATPPVSCDPVRNTGCPALTQCDINLSAATPTGQCVFNGASSGFASPTSGCTSSAVSESCPAQSTCVANECRKMCYCDADCGAGACCKTASGTAGFELCSPC